MIVEMIEFFSYIKLQPHSPHPVFDHLQYAKTVQSQKKNPSLLSRYLELREGFGQLKTGTIYLASYILSRAFNDWALMEPDTATLVFFLSSSYVHMPLPCIATHLLLFPLYALSPSQPLPSPNSAGGSWFSGWRVSTHHHYRWLLLCVLVLQKTERSVYHCILLSTTVNYYHYHSQHVYCAIRHYVLGEQ